MEAWQEIEDFPGYSISNYGRVLNNKLNRFMSVSLIHNGIPTVGLVRGNCQHRRSIPVLVANAWVPKDVPEHFDTPIHLDGNRRNCHFMNLMWRPRWFAIRYHKEVLLNQFPNWTAGPFELLQTQEIFWHPKQCAMRYGVLEMDIFLGLINETPVFPGELKFRLID